MTFRTRLTVFFVLLVIVPMMALGVLVFRLISSSETGKTDAYVSALESAAISRYEAARTQADPAARTIGTDTTLSSALQHGDRRAAGRRAQQLFDALGLSRLEIVAGGVTVADLGDPNAIAPAERVLMTSTGGQVGQVEASYLTATQFARDLTGNSAGAVVRTGGATLAGTIPGASAGALPARGEMKVGSVTYKVASFSAPAFGGTPARISVLADKRRTSSSVSSSRLLALVLLVGFFLLATAMAVVVSRTLQRQIARFLEAAQRLGQGDFSTKVPVEGNDEFSALGAEFNQMSEQLAQRLTELDRERARLRGSIRRIGATFAANLDRRALVELGLQTAVDAVEASAGRASLRIDGGGLEQTAVVGDLDGLESVMRAAEQFAVDELDAVDAEHHGAYALCAPLGDANHPGDLAGLVTVARRGRAFNGDERELFGSLVAQAAISVENADLHDQVQQQAVTDELTGLFNHRRFQEVLASEVERARRFEQQVGLLMLDIDDFKKINDTHGHPQGDVVLREVARVLREATREVDEPARYGGEELAVVLPQTDLDGAYQLAERVRAQIEELRIPLQSGKGTLEVTASIGVAASVAPTRDELIGAADGALYEAKRGGKNRTVRAALATPGRAGSG